MKLPIADCRLPIAGAGGSPRAARTPTPSEAQGRRQHSCACGSSHALSARWRGQTQSQRDSVHPRTGARGLFSILNRQAERRPRRATGKRAFTLIELMVVVGIIGLVAAMGLPSIFKALQKEGMRKAVSDINDVFFTAREQAIVFNKQVAVTFVPKERRFGVDGATGSGDTMINPHSGKTVMATLPKSVELKGLAIYRKDFTDSDYAKIFFNPDGTCDEAIILLQDGRQSEKITLEYATGMPEISAVDQ